MRRFVLTLLTMAAISATCTAKVKDSTDVKFQPDSSMLRPKPMLNDYSMVGANYGISLNHILFNPTQENAWAFRMPYLSVVYTKYTKLFGYLPYFGFSIGAAYGTEGYRFEPNEKGSAYTILGANEVNMKYVEVPMLAQFHHDMEHFKIMANLGLYGGYRLSIERFGDSVQEEYRYSFADTDRRWDYGLHGGVGFSVVFDPVEIQFNGTLRYSWSSIYNPDTFSRYYYRYAYPFDIMITAGLHIHFQPRWGATRKVLRQKAYETVYGGQQDENN